MAQLVREAKAEHPEAICLFRMGDFYEAFDDDAKTIAAKLGLPLTSRGERRMAGFPYHVLEIYLRKLLAEGYKVAIH